MQHGGICFYSHAAFVFFTGSVGQEVFDTSMGYDQ